MGGSPEPRVGRGWEEPQRLRQPRARGRVASGLLSEETALPLPLPPLSPVLASPWLSAGQLSLLLLHPMKEDVPTAPTITAPEFTSQQVTSLAETSWKLSTFLGRADPGPLSASYSEQGSLCPRPCSKSWAVPAPDLQGEGTQRRCASPRRT